MSNLTRTAYDEAKKRYALAGIDTDTALKALSAIPVSKHCWQNAALLSTTIIKHLNNNNSLF